jgi:hypothetical protein
MRKILTALAVAASLTGGGAVATNADAQARYWGGHNHCWYGNGWHGAGWYWCGYANRRGYGWGGPAGWNGWGGGGVVVRGPGITVGVGGPGRPGYWGGRHYCWYGNGWHGGGWYWCGANWRRGYGWGGPRGWNHW